MAEYKDLRQLNDPNPEYVFRFSYFFLHINFIPDHNDFISDITETEENRVCLCKRHVNDMLVIMIYCGVLDGIFKRIRALKFKYETLYAI